MLNLQVALATFIDTEKPISPNTLAALGHDSVKQD